MYNDFGYIGPTEGMGAGFAAAFYLIYFMVVAGIGIATYVFQSVSFFTIAKRRGIKNPWLSWLPVGDMWILGCISDQYRYVAKGQVKNKRKSLLVLNILMWVFTVMVLTIVVMMVVSAIGMDPNGDLTEVLALKLIGSVFGTLAAYLILLGISIAITVIQYMALYDLFVSCDPGNGVLYLVLSILVGIAQPICLFLCRKKDGGMPPRRPTAPVFVPQPVYRPAQPR